MSNSSTPGDSVEAGRAPSTPDSLAAAAADDTPRPRPASAAADTGAEAADVADGRRRLMAAAAAELVERGAGQLSLRAIARRAGLSHNAAGHHFGDRAGLLTAVAVDGFEQLTRTLQEARTSAGRHGGDDFSALGRAYLDFGLAQPALLDLMFRPDLLRRDDPALAAAQQGAFGVLEVTATSVRGELPAAGPGAPTPDDPSAPARDDHSAPGERDPGTELALVAWSFVHGLVGLARYGALDQGGGGEAAAVARGLLASFGRLIGRSGAHAQSASTGGPDPGAGTRLH